MVIVLEGNSRRCGGDVGGEGKRQKCDGGGDGGVVV